jgi:hypothetical protein
MKLCWNYPIYYTYNSGCKLYGIYFGDVFIGVSISIIPIIEQMRGNK